MVLMKNERGSRPIRSARRKQREASSSQFVRELEMLEQSRCQMMDLDAGELGTDERQSSPHPALLSELREVDQAHFAPLEALPDVVTVEAAATLFVAAVHKSDRQTNAD